MTLAQIMICRWIRENHAGADAEPVDQCTVRMTENGETRLLSLNIQGDIFDLTTRQILGR